MGKVVNLTVHRNTRDQRQFRYVRGQLRQGAKELPAGTVGYALVTWDAGCNAKTTWDTAGTMPSDVMPDYVRRVMLRTIAKDDARNLIFPRKPDDA